MTLLVKAVNRAPRKNGGHTGAARPDGKVRGTRKEPSIYRSKKKERKKEPRKEPSIYRLR